MTALSRTKILVTEDDARMSELLRRGLTAEGAEVATARTGAEALALAGAQRFDVVVLDLMLPDIDGFDVCRQLRDERRWVPILMLTARDELDDRVSGLESGADDYLAKPFAFDELIARLRALIRRDRRHDSDVLAVGDLQLNVITHRVRRGDDDIELSAREFDLLETFMRHPGQVLTRWALLEEAWPGGLGLTPNVVDVYVRYLREKIDRPFGRATLKTVRGRGYRLVADDAPP